MSKSTNLSNAKKVKNDEFYTKLQDIEKEILKYEKSLFEDKIILCNCDKPEYSNFYYFFKKYFDILKLKKVIFTYYSNENKVIGKIIEKNVEKSFVLPDQGDFRTENSINILKSADIIITNPPFSLFRDYLNLLIKYEKQFIIIGSLNSVTYKDVFKYIKENKLWIGETFPNSFIEPTGSEKKFGNICWFTNIPNNKRIENINLEKKYKNNESFYPNYDNYEAIEISKIKDIPVDYKGIMGVPITFLNNYNPEQFKIVGQTTGRNEFECYPIKKYINPKQHNLNGNISNGSKINTRATIKLEKEINSIFYSADNIDYFLKVVYARILIKKI